MFNMLDFIERKRDGGTHKTEELDAFVAAVRDEKIPDYQTAAWLMATFIHGLDRDELAAFTSALALSGDVVKLFHAPNGARAVDKHSTGGVGDKTTLIVAPLVAACGAHVAKLSGRGLGFTGGTVDKLESIPGMEVHLSAERFVKQVEGLGAAISGHSLALAPAEGKFYALRDVTGTVPSLPLIASSIVSKKIAGGGDAFVFDVKCGSGAFMQTPEEASALARALVDLAMALGKKSVCLISDMEQPLGEWIGNSVEVLEAIEVLSGTGPSDTRELSIALAAEMLVLAGVAKNPNEAKKTATEALDGGRALAKFAEIVGAQGGKASVCDKPMHVLPRAGSRMEIRAETSGKLARMDARTIGYAVRAMGGGRLRKEDVIDPAVGLRVLKKIGDTVAQNEPLIEVYYNTEPQLNAALPYVASSYAVAPDAAARTLIHGRVE